MKQLHSPPRASSAQPADVKQSVLPPPPKRPVLSLRKTEPVTRAPKAPPTTASPKPRVESKQLPWDQPFFFVWSPSEHRPKRRHSTLESAAAEAARLSALYPDKEFFAFRAERVQP